MTRIFIYLFILGIVLYFLWARSSYKGGGGAAKPQGKAGRWFKPKRNPMEIWVQVYETADLNEAKMIQARLQEEDLDCIVYEQGKKDIHGNEPKGVGVAVPKSGIGRAQNVISRMPV